MSKREEPKVGLLEDDWFKSMRTCRICSYTLTTLCSRKSTWRPSCAIPGSHSLNVFWKEFVCWRHCVSILHSFFAFAGLPGSSLWARSVCMDPRGSYHLLHFIQLRMSKANTCYLIFAAERFGHVSSKNKLSMPFTTDLLLPQLPRLPLYCQQHGAIRGGGFKTSQLVYFSRLKPKTHNAKETLQLLLESLCGGRTQCLLVLRGTGLWNVQYANSVRTVTFWGEAQWSQLSTKQRTAT